MFVPAFMLLWIWCGFDVNLVGCCGMIAVAVYRGFCLVFYSVVVVYVWFGGFVVFGRCGVAMFNSAEALRFFVCFCNVVFVMVFVCSA